MIDIFSGMDRGAGVVSVLSGGLDSSILTALLTRHFETVHAISFFYKQKQCVELSGASALAKFLGIEHQIIDISFLGDIVKDVSSNVLSSEIDVPNIKDVLGHPQPVTYVPNRNSILLNIAAAYAETKGLSYVSSGLQSHDSYGYFDTTPEFVKSINDLWSLNRLHNITLMTPFINLKKVDEIRLLIDELGKDAAMEVFEKTLTCYNPDDYGKSCGVCPSCSERINAFLRAGVVDPIPYNAGPFHRRG